MTRWNRPTVAILWNGVPLEEYGVADALISVSYTKTVGRTKPSKRFKAGKPKVGGATLKFELSCDAVAQRLIQMVTTSSRPRITLGVGYDDSEHYWVGGFGANKDELIKKKYQAISFKLDAPTWDYGGNVPTMTISGLNNKVLGMGEKFKPRVYTEQTVEQILKGIADEHGFVLDMEGMSNRSTKVKNLLSPADESDLAFVNRLTAAAGNAMVQIYEDNFSQPSDGKLAVKASLGEGATRAVDYQVYGDRNPQPVRVWATRARTIMKIRSLPSYLDLGAMEQGAVPILAYNVKSADLPRGRTVIDALSLKVVTTGYKSGPSAHAGQQNKKDGTQGNVVAPVNHLPGEKPPEQLDVTEAFENAKEATTKTGTKAKKDAPRSPYRQVVTPLPYEFDDGELTSSFLRMLAEHNHFSWQVTATVVPGVPWLQAPILLEVRGTHGHDGLYGVETSTLTWGPNGLQNSLTLKPASSTSTDTTRRKSNGQTGNGTNVIAPPNSLPNEGAPKSIDVTGAFVQGIQAITTKTPNKERESKTARNLGDSSQAVPQE